MIKKLRTRIAVNHANAYGPWWDAAREHPEPPPPLRPLLDGTRASVLLDADAAEVALRWAQSLPDWRGGPYYAPTPLVWSRE